MKDAVDQILTFVFQFVVHNRLQFLNENRRSCPDTGDQIAVRKALNCTLLKNCQKLQNGASSVRSTRFFSQGEGREL